MNERKTSPRIGGPEVTEKAQRRKFSAAYRLRIVEEANRCQEFGQIGEILRREGLYASQSARWRRQRAAGELSEGQSAKRGRKRKAVDATRNLVHYLLTNVVYLGKVRYQAEVHEGKVRDQAELANLSHVSRARITQIMNLLQLAPDIQEALLDLPKTVKGVDPIRDGERRYLPRPAESISVCSCRTQTASSFPVCRSRRR